MDSVGVVVQDCLLDCTRQEIVLSDTGEGIQARNKLGKTDNIRKLILQQRLGS